MKWKLSLVFSILLSSLVNAQILKTEDGQLNYTVRGEGPAILIINGGPGLDSKGFASLADSLGARGFSAITYDQRGTGASSLKDSSNISLSAMVDDIELIRQDLRIKQWIVLGHSFGGILANAYAVKYPNAVKGIIHSASAGMNLAILEVFNSGVDHHLSEKEVIKLSKSKTQLDEQGGLESTIAFLKAKAQVYTLDTTYLDAIAQRLLSLDIRINEMIWSELVQMQFDLRDSLTNFVKPVLIIQGDQDIIPLDMAQDMYNTFPNARLSVLSHCRHYGWIDASQIYFLEIERFISDLCPA